jgi:hypothetical protein
VAGAGLTFWPYPSNVLRQRLADFLDLPGINEMIEHTENGTSAVSGGHRTQIAQID